MSSLSQSGAHLSGIFLTALMTGCSPAFAMQHIVAVPHGLVRRSLLGTDLLMTRTLCSPGPSQPREKRPEAAALGLYHRLPALGRALGHSIQQQATSTAKAWWDRYEEFVGLNEVREAQGNVTEVRREPGWLALPLFWEICLGFLTKKFPSAYVVAAGKTTWTVWSFLFKTASYVSLAGLGIPM